MAYIRYKDKKKYRYYELPEDRMLVFGREDHVDFQILNDPLISREHFAVEKDDDGSFIINDLGSHNGTYHNDNKMENEIHSLKNGDSIAAGTQKFIYYDKIPKGENEKLKSDAIFNEVEGAVSTGKGYATILREILKK